MTTRIQELEAEQRKLIADSYSRILSDSEWTLVGLRLDTIRRDINRYRREINAKLAGL